MGKAPRCLVPEPFVAVATRKRQRNQRWEETKVTMEFGIQNGGSGRFLLMVRAIMRTRLI